MSNDALTPQAMLLKNWTDASGEYSSSIRTELRSFKRQAWLDLIQENNGGKKNMRVLDVGTGPGFFAILLALEGHDVTAIDCTQAMLEEAKKNALAEHASVDFRAVDAHNTGFGNNQFDLIVSRNVTWTLFNAEQAYKEWWNILAPGGRLLIFDANWNLWLFNADLKRQHERDVEEYRRLYNEDAHPCTPEMEAYRKSMPMCQRVRPEWDLNALKDAGFVNIKLDPDVWKRIYNEKEKLKYRSSLMFMLAAEKGQG